MNRPGHGPNDFEDRLRAALRRRADDVVPDPHLWGRVQERAGRRRWSRWLGAAATVTPLLAAVGVALVLGLPDDDAGVSMADLGPVPTATVAAPAVTATAQVDAAPAPSASPEASPSAPAETPSTSVAQVVPSATATGDRVLVLATSPGLVVTDANARQVDVVVTEPASECIDVEGCEAEVVSDIHARPGSSSADIAVTFLESFEPCLGRAGYATRVYGAVPLTDEGQIALPDDPCPSAPVWSPDGTWIAWLERAAGGGLDLVTVPWEGGGAPSAASAPPSRAAIASDLPLEQMMSPKIVEWVPDADGATVLYVTGDAFGEDRVLLSMPVAIAGAGAEPSGPLVALSAAGDGSSSLTYTSAGESGTGYLINRPQDAQDGRLTALKLVREDGEAAPQAPALDLPAELVDAQAPDGELVWVRARGGEVLFGDGVDQAWRVFWDGTVWSPLEALPGGIRSADFLDPAGS